METPLTAMLASVQILFDDEDARAIPGELGVRGRPREVSARLSYRGHVGRIARLLPWPLIFALALIPTAYRLNIKALVAFAAAPWNLDVPRAYVLLVLAVASWLAVPALLWVQVGLTRGAIEARAILAAAGLAVALWTAMTWQSGKFLAWTVPHMAYQTRLAIKLRSQPWIELSPDGTDVAVRTEYMWGVSEKVIAFVRSHPGVRSLTLSGPGGVTWEGSQIARFVMDRGLETRVMDDCHSACAGVFLAGRRRVLRVDGKEGLLGLHASHVEREGKVERVWNEGAFEILRRAGATDAFIWRIWQTDPEGLWKPTPNELAQGGISVEVVRDEAMQRP